jgi:hypothetical protein
MALSEAARDMLSRWRGRNSWDKGIPLNPLVGLIDDWGVVDDVTSLKAFEAAARDEANGLTKDIVGTIEGCVRGALERIASVPRLEGFLKARTLGAELSPHFRALVAEPCRIERVLALIDRHAEEPENAEPLFVLCHDLSMRGAASMDRPSIRALEERMRAAGHPLAWMPLARTQLEGDAILAVIFCSVHSARGAPLPAHEHPPAHRVRDEAASTRGSSVAPLGQDEARLITAATAEWGSSEAALLRASDKSETLMGMLKASGLEWIDPATLEVHAVDPGEAFAELFHAACGGSAYNHERGVAWGRLDAWRSAAGLTGLGADAPFEQVLERATSDRWLKLKSESPWFVNYGWDLCLGVLRSNSSEAALLAGTDSD